MAHRVLLRPFMAGAPYLRGGARTRVIGPLVEPAIQRAGAMLGFLRAFDLVALAVRGRQIVRRVLAAIGQRQHMIEREIVQRHRHLTDATEPLAVPIPRMLQHMRQLDRPHRADHSTPARAAIQPERPTTHDIDHPVIERRGPFHVLLRRSCRRACRWSRRLTRHLMGGWDAAIARGWRAWGILRRAGGRGRAHHTRPCGQYWGLTERRGRKINRRGFRGMRQRRLNGWMTRPRTPCGPGVGISSHSPYRTRRRNANHKTIRGTIPHSPSFGLSRPIYHTSCCIHTHRTGNPSTSSILLASAYLS